MIHLSFKIDSAIGAVSKITCTLFKNS